MPYKPIDRSALSVSDEERRAVYEEAWRQGGFKFVQASFNDVAIDRRANDTASEFIRSKIREIVKDPETAEKLVPRIAGQCHGDVPTRQSHDQMGR